MSLLHPATSGKTVAVWLVDGIPVRLVHDGTRYRVTDTPTRLEDENPDLTHRLGITGWRFQGTDDAGSSFMFDIRPDGGRWRLIRAWD